MKMKMKTKENKAVQRMGVTTRPGKYRTIA
jgi:hypothetical protein